MQSTQNINIIKSQSDSKLYRFLTLENKMKVLLIQDEKCDKAAASLTVKVGSFQEKDHPNGIAHFLEHMLFLGTEKYPDENSFSLYIKDHGGEHNAHTSNENTTFYFQILPDYLTAALDHFAQFFIKPLFTASATDREINAVNSEFVNATQNDIWRCQYILKMLASPDNKFSKFTNGNKESLDVPNIRDMVVDFYNNSYSANLMNLVILGKENLDSMQQWVQSVFNQVENHNFTEVQASCIPQFPIKETGQFLKVVPINDTKEIFILWQTPSTIPYYKTKPEQYISHLIGHEGKNSLLSMLKEKSLAYELVCGSFQVNSNFGFLFCKIQLTDQGYQQYQEVIELLYGYINQVLVEKGVEEWVWKEEADMSEVNFRFKSKEQPAAYVVSLSESLC